MSIKKGNSIKKSIYSNYFILFIIILYKLLVDFCYYSVMTPVWGYMRLETDFNVRKWVVSIIAMMIIALFVRWDGNSFSDIAIQVLFVVCIIPLSTYYSLANQSDTFFACCCLSFFLTTFLVNRTSQYSFFISKIQVSTGYLGLILCFFTVLFSSYIIKRTGINIRFINIIDSQTIYGARANIDLKLGGLATYFYLWSSRITIPLFIGIFFSKKKYLLGIGLVIIQIALYLGNPHKEMLFGIVLLFVVVTLNKFFNPGKLFLFGGLLTIIGGNTLYFRGHKIGLYIEAILSRLLYVPASLKFLHYDFFTSHEKLYFSEGRIGQLFGFNYPYSSSVGIEIGRYFFGVDSNCNAGYLAYAYDDLGYLGIFFVGICLFFVLKIMDYYINDDTSIWIRASILYPLILLNDSPFLSWLLSGGILYLLFVLYISKPLIITNNERTTLEGIG